MGDLLTRYQKYRTLFITLAFIVVLFLMAIQGMDTRDWVITLLRSLSVGALIFLVASGFSIIFGLMDVLNLAHGTLFMVGAYMGWTVFVRPDTFIDLLTPGALLLAGLTLTPFWRVALARGLVRWTVPPLLRKILPWALLVIAGLFLWYSLPRYPITIWNPAVYADSPGVFAFNASQPGYTLPTPKLFTTNPYMVLVELLLGSALLGISIAAFGLRKEITNLDTKAKLPRRNLWGSIILLAVGLSAFMFHGALTDFIFSLNQTLLFLVAIAVAFGVGFALGMLIETTLIRPLYARPVYQILMTLGISLVGVEVVRAIWGRPEFMMPKPALFSSAGEGCPGTNLIEAFANNCSTMFVFDGRIRTYNEVFVPLVGLFVLVAVWMLLQRTRLGMIIRAGVQDSQMVEALGINVRQVFTLVFALGVGLAALGGVIAGPSIGLSTGMGELFLINALIALAIGGLTSFPGAAVGSILVGLIQQFIIKYGQIGINIPFMEEPFKPTPPLVPASTVLLMVIVLLLLPNGLLGRKE